VQVQTHWKVEVLSIDEEEKVYPSSQSKHIFCKSKKFYLFDLDTCVFDNLLRKRQINMAPATLENLKDFEIVNAFRVAVMQAHDEEDILNPSEFYKIVGTNFMNLLTKKQIYPENELEQRLLEMNIQSDANTEKPMEEVENWITSLKKPILSDFGDIIPVNITVENETTRKHQKWTIGEQKKLASQIKSRNLSEIPDEEWALIALKFNRTIKSVKQKAKEVSMKPLASFKKQKIVEHPRNNFCEDTVFMEASKIGRENHTLLNSEIDAYTESKWPSLKSDCLFVSRKKAIESVLEKLPQKRGTKKQIFDIMAKMYNLSLDDKSSSNYKGFHQCLSKYFNHIKGYYTLKFTDPEFEVLNSNLRTLADCGSWKEKSFFILNQFPNKKARLNDIKLKVEELLRDTSMNLSESDRDISLWEKNMLKIFSKHYNLFDTSNSKTIFYIW
jgi:hypothetical protein